MDMWCVSPVNTLFDEIILRKSIIFPVCVNNWGRYGACFGGNEIVL